MHGQGVCGRRRHARPSEENARLFHDRISALAKAGDPHAAAADTHTADEYERDELYLNEDGTAGFALRDGDELVSVFTYPDTHAGDAIAEKAVAQGRGHATPTVLTAQVQADSQGPVG